MTPIAAPTLAPLLLPRQAAAGDLTGGGTAPAATEDTLRGAPAAGPIAPADFAALRDYLARYGTFRPAPPDPPWDDPRPDLRDDHGRWWLLLEAAYRLDGADPAGLFGALVGLRGCGARLEIAGPANWTLQPEGPLPTWRLVRGAEMSEAEYQGYRATYLVPHREALTRLLSAPTAASIAHARPASAQTTGKTPEKHRQSAAPATFTGRATAPTTTPAPRKNGDQPAAQPALLAAERIPEPAPMAGGDW